MNGRVDLKVFLQGFLLSGSNDPAIDFLFNLNRENLDYLAKHIFRLADQTPFHTRIWHLTRVNRAGPLKIKNLFSKQVYGIELNHRFQATVSKLSGRFSF